jgi:hypothetical protein
MPLWLRGLLFACGSLALGAVLAHFSGRAMWQDPRAPLMASPASREPAPESTELTIDLPVVPPASEVPEASKSSAPKLVAPPIPRLAAVDLEPKRPAGSPLPVSVSPPFPTGTAGTIDESLAPKLAELRRTGEQLPAELRVSTERAARNGSTEAMLALGRMHLRGEAGKVDERSAFTWFDRAMSAGDTAATVPLAQCYLQGRGTPHDLALAVDLLVKAAASGDPGAKDLLVQAARLGNAEAANWCRQRGVAY